MAHLPRVEHRFQPKRVLHCADGNCAMNFENPGCLVLWLPGAARICKISCSITSNPGKTRESSVAEETAQPSRGTVTSVWQFFSLRQRSYESCDSQQSNEPKMYEYAIERISAIYFLLPDVLHPFHCPNSLWVYNHGSHHINDLQRASCTSLEQKQQTKTSMNFITDIHRPGQFSCSSIHERGWRWQLENAQF